MKNYGESSSEKDPVESSSEEEAFYRGQGYSPQIAKTRESGKETAGKINLVESKHDRRATRLAAVARELRKIGYIVVETSSKRGLLVMQHPDEPCL